MSFRLRLQLKSTARRTLTTSSKMSPQNFRVALVQLGNTSADKSANLNRAAAKMYAICTNETKTGHIADHQNVLVAKQHSKRSSQI